MYGWQIYGWQIKGASYIQYYCVVANKERLRWSLHYILYNLCVIRWFVKRMLIGLRLIVWGLLNIRNIRSTLIMSFIRTAFPPMLFPSLLALLIIDVSVFIGASAVFAQEQSEPSSRQAHIDPNSGELASEPPVQVEQNRSSSAQDNAAEVKIVNHPDGMQEAVLDGHMDSSFEVILDCDGAIHSQHDGSASDTSTRCNPQ